MLWIQVVASYSYSFIFPRRGNFIFTWYNGNVPRVSFDRDRIIEEGVQNEVEEITTSLTDEGQRNLTQFTSAQTAEEEDLLDWGTQPHMLRRPTSKPLAT